MEEDLSLSVIQIPISMALDFPEKGPFVPKRELVFSTLRETDAGRASLKRQKVRGKWTDAKQEPGGERVHLGDGEGRVDGKADLHEKLGGEEADVTPAEQMA